MSSIVDMIRAYSHFDDQIMPLYKVKQSELCSFDLFDTCWRMVLARESWRLTWPNHTSLWRLIITRSGSCLSARVSVCCLTYLLVLCSMQWTWKCFRLQRPPCLWQETFGTYRHKVWLNSLVQRGTSAKKCNGAAGLRPLELQRVRIPKMFTHNFLFVNSSHNFISFIRHDFSPIS